MSTTNDKLIKLFDVYNDYFIESLTSNPKVKEFIAETVAREVEKQIGSRIENGTLRNDDDPARLIDIDELAKLLNRSKNTVRVDITRRPHTLPPQIKLPGSRMIRWRLKDVRDWIEKEKT